MDAVELLEDLVRIRSVNRSLGGSGEAEVGARIAEELRALGADVRTHPVDGEGAPNVIGVLQGAVDGPVVLLEAHMDTVPPPERPLVVERSGGRLSGRGSCDTKGSAAAMLAALERLGVAGELPGTVVFAGVVDEEATMRGSGALLDQLPALDAAIIGEPTSLRPMRAHNGFARIRLIVHGRAAHTSKAHLGVNAISVTARVLAALEAELYPRLAERGHPLIGPALLTPSVVRGGATPNVVPDRCELTLDRRIAPGEDPRAAVAELDELLDRLRAQGHAITREEPFVLLPGVETPGDHPVVAAAAAASSRLLGGEVTPGGVPYSTDACQLQGIGGLPCVVLGPGSIDQAHTVDEWIDLREVEQAVDLYADAVRRFLARAGGTAGRGGA